METFESVVIGAGQAGLSTSFHLRRLGVDHVVLDANDRPGGAWQHRWDSLSMDDVHGVADLPGSPAPGRGARAANAVVPAWFADYEAAHELPVVRPVRVERVTSAEDLLVVTAPGQSWQTRTLVNATGTWATPFIPHYPGIGSFRGEQLHSSSYAGAAAYSGRRVLVVGGGASAVQLLGEIALIDRDAVGDPSAPRLAHRRLQPGRRSGSRGTRRGAGAPGAASGQCRQRDGARAP